MSADRCGGSIDCAWGCPGCETSDVRFDPCASFRIPLEGDLLTCRDCGWWIEEHPSRDIEPEECE